MLLVAVFLVVVPLWQNPVPQLLALGGILLGVPVFVVFVMDQPIRLKPRVFDSLSSKYISQLHKDHIDSPSLNINFLCRVLN